MFNRINYGVSPKRAREIALDEICAKTAEFTWQKIVDNHGAPMYELELNAEGMCYSMCIDANSGVILGFSSAPMVA